MDPNKESKSMTNSSKAEHDSEINSHSRGTPKEVQAGQGDMEVRFPRRPPSPWQNTSNTHIQRQRDPQPFHPDEGPTRSSEPTPENHIATSGSSQCQINSNGGLNDSPTPGSSKSNLNINNGLDPNIAPLSKYKLEVDKDGLGHINLEPHINRDAIDDRNNIRENRKRPSSLKLNRPNMDDDSSSLSDYSLGSEDGCIYTYRGGEHLADLPSSFFSLDMGFPADRLVLQNYGAPQEARNAREEASSPDMDFLEMDFDPGPSNEGDSGEESTSNPDLNAAMEMPEEMPVRGPTPNKAAESCSKFVVVAGGSHSDANWNRPSTSRETNSSLIRPQNWIPQTSRGVTSSSHARPTVTAPRIVYGPYITHINARGDPILVRRTMMHSVGPVTYHLFGGGELVPRLPPDSESSLPDCPFPLSQIRETFGHIEFDILVSASVYHASQANALLSAKEAHKDGNSSNVSDAASEPVASTSTATSCVEPPRSMIWSEAAACERQVTQIGVSACGATAVVNVFNALGVPVDIERINTSVGTRLRANNAPIPSYLLSRAVAGCTAADIINGIQIASGGLVTARFFPTYPERAMSLSHFLADWISLGGVPILTLNLQNGSDAIKPDAWHHQMVFGVSPQGIYLCNPVECVRENILWTRLVSPSVLLVKARDVVSRFTEDTDLTPLMYVPDARFHTFNVFGQVANVLRESRLPWRQDSNPRTQHVRIPAAYQAGITIAVLTGSEAHQRLMVAAQFPLLDSKSNDNPQNDPA